MEGAISYNMGMAGELEPRRGAGRPSMFNEDRAEKLLQAVRGGNHLKVAAAFAGISYSTLRRWILKADDPGAPPEYVEFKAAVEKAQADAEVAALAKIQKASTEGNWHAAAWYLERSYPERWGKRETNRVELVGGDGGPVRMVAGIEISTESMEALASRLAARKDERDSEIVDAEIIDDYAAELDEAPAGTISDSEIEVITEAWGEENDDDGSGA